MLARQNTELKTSAPMHPRIRCGIIRRWRAERRDGKWQVGLGPAENSKDESEKKSNATQKCRTDFHALQVGQARWGTRT
jgi:hypothetical protein